MLPRKEQSLVEILFAHARMHIAHEPTHAAVGALGDGLRTRPPSRRNAIRLLTYCNQFGLGTAVAATFTRSHWSGFRLEWTTHHCSRSYHWCLFVCLIQHSVDKGTSKASQSPGCGARATASVQFSPAGTLT